MEMIVEKTPEVGRAAMATTLLLPAFLQISASRVPVPLTSSKGVKCCSDPRYSEYPYVKSFGLPFSIPSSTTLMLLAPISTPRKLLDFFPPKNFIQENYTTPSSFAHQDIHSLAHLLLC